MGIYGQVNTPALLLFDEWTNLSIFPNLLMYRNVYFWPGQLLIKYIEWIFPFLVHVKSVLQKSYVLLMQQFWPLKWK